MDILIYSDKYGSTYYDASTPEALDKSARLVIKKNLDSGFIYSPTPLNFTDEEAEVLAMSEESLAALPPKLRASVEEQRDYLAMRQDEYDEEFEQYDAATKLAAGGTAAEIFRTREDEDDEAWAEISRAWIEARPNRSATDSQLRANFTAMDFLELRSANEYEQYTLDSVITHGD